MPFRSGRQRRYLWAVRPDVAARWARVYGRKKRKARRRASSD